MTLRAAALALLASCASAQETPPPLACFGTEPFWSLSLDANDAVFERASEGETRWRATALTAASGRPGPPWLATLSGETQAYALLNQAACSDGMSDRTHPWSISLILPAKDGSELLDGCCRRPESP